MGYDRDSLALAKVSQGLHTEFPQDPSFQAEFYSDDGSAPLPTATIVLEPDHFGQNRAPYCVAMKRGVVPNVAPPLTGDPAVDAPR